MADLSETPLGSLCLSILEVVEDAERWAAEADDQADLLARFALIEDALQALKEAHRVVGREVLYTADDGDEIPGGGQLRITGGNTKKKYDVELLRGAVTNALASYVGLDDDPRVAEVVRAAWEIAPATPSAGFRSTAARRYGIDLRKYCEEETTPRSVKIEDRPVRVFIEGRMAPAVIAPIPGTVDGGRSLTQRSHTDGNEIPDDGR